MMHPPVNYMAYMLGKVRRTMCIVRKSPETSRTPLMTKNNFCVYNISPESIFHKAFCRSVSKVTGFGLKLAVARIQI